MGLSSVFLSHYRRHPTQLIGLLLILVCAAMLWSGVRTLTAAAEKSVTRSQEALEPLTLVLREDGRAITVDDFATLRRSGLCVSPRLEVRFADTGAPMVVGIDPLTAACLRQYRGGAPAMNSLFANLDKPALLGAPADLKRWQVLAPAGSARYALEPVDGLPRRQLLTDIAVAAELAARGHGTLELLLPESELEKQTLPAGYRTQVEDYGVTPAPLVDAFLLSLNALSVLALLVAALLVRSVYRFALEQRRRSLDLLVRFGVRPLQLRLALIVEIVLIALVGGTLGMWLGGWLAAAMADGFQGTLSGLFGVSGAVAPAPRVGTWLSMVLILVLIVGWAGLDLLVQRAETQPYQTVQSRLPKWAGQMKRWWLWAGVFLVSLVMLLFTQQLWLVFLAAAGCLLGVGLLLPEILNGLLALVQHRTVRPLLEWSCSEMRALCRVLHLPLTALAFAIATVIGVHAMVNGFENTFDRWLDQRLRGDLYLDPGGPIEAADWQRKLQNLPGVSAVLPMVRGRGLLASGPVDVMTIDATSPLVQAWPFIAAESDVWEALIARGVLVNEQLARRHGVGVGDRLSFQVGDAKITRDVVGIYADYGRPQGELMLAQSALWEAPPQSYTTFVLGAEDIDTLPWRAWPERHPWLAASRIRDQQELKGLANAAFARTFQMTRVLNTLTLALAGVALGLMGLVIFRLRQAPYTLLHACGVPANALRKRLVTHSLLITGLLALLATPLGVFLGWVLVAQVNPAAFGWALPLKLYPLFWLQVWIASAAIGALVGLLAGSPVRLGALKND